MTASQRKKAHARVKKLADDARHLAVWGSALTPTHVARLVAKLADELAKVLAPPRRQTRGRTA
jgi:hypothetical protein